MSTVCLQVVVYIYFCSLLLRIIKIPVSLCLLLYHGVVTLCQQLGFIYNFYFYINLID